MESMNDCMLHCLNNRSISHISLFSGADGNSYSWKSHCWYLASSVGDYTIQFHHHMKLTEFLQFAGTYRRGKVCWVIRCLVVVFYAHFWQTIDIIDTSIHVHIKITSMLEVRHSSCFDLMVFHGFSLNTRTLISLPLIISSTSVLVCSEWANYFSEYIARKYWSMHFLIVSAKVMCWISRISSNILYVHERFLVSVCKL